SPAEVQRAFARAGVRLRSTRAGELREVDHPAVPPLLEYKELARLHAAHGWGWLSAWVRDGRFRPEYVPGGVVSGRWASRGGEAGSLVAALHARFPVAVGYVEQAARTGERGGIVRSRLGRTCPPPSAGWQAAQAAATEPGADLATVRRALTAAADRGRFTRNFVVQASAADWALVLLAELRRRVTELATAAAGAGAPAPELVFFQHDEVVVHCPEPAAEA